MNRMYFLMSHITLFPNSVSLSLCPMMILFAVKLGHCNLIRQCAFCLFLCAYNISCSANLMLQVMQTFLPPVDLLVCQLFDFPVIRQTA